MFIKGGASAVIDRVKSGEKLCKSLRHKVSGELEVTHLFEPSGKRCNPTSAERAIKSGELRPLNDGLFDPDTSQTWGAA